jgi:hypothetical protein
MAEGTLELRRGDDSVGILRRINIEVDGSLVAGLKPNDRAEVRLSEGPHTVRALLDWTKSEPKKVNIPADGKIILTTALPWAGFWRMITAPNSTLTLQEA